VEYSEMHALFAEQQRAAGLSDRVEVVRGAALEVSTSCSRA